MNLNGLGIDIVEVKRFKVFKNKKDNFLFNNFSKQELDYCFSYKDPGTHLAGTFAIKEAVWKALGQKKLLSSTIEIRRDKTGQPTVWLNHKQQTSILVSISHTAKTAVAIAIKV
jgi:phosphopantetheine--protein transferase-like protein